MPRPRFGKLTPERRRQILDGAARQFAERGFFGASLNGILADVGVSKGAAYYYFDDKADLFATVVEEAWATASAGVSFEPSTLTRDTWWPALEALYRSQVTSFPDRPWMWRAAKAMGPALADPEVGPVLLARLSPIVAFIQAIPERAAALGLVRTDLPPGLVAAMVGGLDAAIDDWLLANPAAVADPDVVAAAFASLRAAAEGRPDTNPADPEAWEES